MAKWGEEVDFAALGSARFRKIVIVEPVWAVVHEEPAGSCPRGICQWLSCNAVLAFCRAWWWGCQCFHINAFVLRMGRPSNTRAGWGWVNQGTSSEFTLPGAFAVNGGYLSGL